MTTPALPAHLLAEADQLQARQADPATVAADDAFEAAVTAEASGTAVSDIFGDDAL